MASSGERHIDHYEALKRSQENGVKYNTNKSQIKEEVKFYRHYMAANGLELNPIGDGP